MHMPAMPKFKLFLWASLRTSSNFLWTFFKLSSNFLWTFFDFSSNFLQTKFEKVQRKSLNILFEELQTFLNRAKKKNVLEFIQFLWNFLFFQKNELSRRSWKLEMQHLRKCLPGWLLIGKIQNSYSLRACTTSSSTITNIQCTQPQKTWRQPPPSWQQEREQGRSHQERKR
jgi:hypothetical protein